MRRPITFVASAPTARTTSRVIRMPSPGTSRPKTRDAKGAVKRSMIPKIHTKANTLTTNGMVMKKPVMSLRRSHCMELSRRERHQQRDAARNSVPREWSKTRPPDERQERPYHKGRRDERGDKPYRDLGGPVWRQRRAHLQQLIHKGGKYRRHRKSEEHTSELQSQSNLVCR